MKYGIISGIHGNREALGAVLRQLDRRGVQRIVCLGDIVGYNADPDECVAMLRERRAICIAGDHDLAGAGRADPQRYPNSALYSLKRTRRSLSPKSAAYLSSLPPHHALERAVLVHEAPEDLARQFPESRLFFIGSSEQRNVCEVHHHGVRELEADGKLQLDASCAYFIHTGAVDASRKREHKLAECAILDTQAWTVEFLRARYDTTAAELKAAVFGYRIGPWTDWFYSFRRLMPRPLGWA